MTVLTGNLEDLAGIRTDGVVWLSSLMARPARTRAATVITPERHRIELVGGRFTSPELDPGPTIVEVDAAVYIRWEITLPEEGRHDLADLLEKIIELPPPVIGRVEAAANEASKSAAAAAESAGRAESAAGRVDGVVADAASAVRVELAAELTAAGQSAEQSATAAAAAEQSAAAAQDAAGRADAVVTDAAGALSKRLTAEMAAVTDARNSADAAADRAERAAGSAAADAAAGVTAATGADAARASDAARRAEASAQTAQTQATRSQGFADDAGAACGESVNLRDQARLARDAGATARDEADAARVAAEAARTAAAESADRAARVAAETVTAEIAKIVDGAPEHLDTLAEIAAALGDQADVAAALTTQIAGKADARHTHDMGDVTGLAAALEARAPASHQHQMSQVEGLVAALDTVTDELGRRARGNFDVVVATMPPGPDTPLTQVTLVGDALHEAAGTPPEEASPPEEGEG